MKKSKFQNKNLLVSFKYAFEGIFSALKTERNLRIDILIMIGVLILGIILKISLVEWLICIILFALVKNPQAKLAKDLAAGAVLIIALSTIVVGTFIFLPKIVNLF